MGSRTSYKSVSIDPATVTDFWLRPGDIGGADGSVVSTIPLIKGGTAPTAQSGQEAVLSTSANGKRIITLSSECFSWPLDSTNNDTTIFWIGLWIRPTDLVGTSALFTVNTQAGGGGINRISCHLSGANVLMNVNATDGSTARRGITTTAPMTLNQWTFVLWLFDGLPEDLDAEDADRCKIYVNGGQETLTFAANPTETEMPPSLLEGTGNGWLFGTSGGGSPVTGEVGPDIFGGKTVPTDEQMARLQDYDIPTV